MDSTKCCFTYTPKHNTTTVFSVMPRSRFLGDTGVPLPEFQGDIHKFWGHTKSFKFLPVKLNSYPEIPVNFSFKFELDVDSFGSIRGADDSEIVSQT